MAEPAANAAPASSLPDMKLEMFSRPEFLAAARAMIGKFAHRVGFSDNECGQIMLALDEALCNVINHGYGRKPDGRIWISIWSQAGGDQQPAGLKVVLEDQGRQVDPVTIRSRDLDDIRPGGLGVHIIRQTMDEVIYEKRPGEGMRLTLVKKIGRHSSASAGAACTGGDAGRCCSAPVSEGGD